MCHIETKVFKNPACHALTNCRSTSASISSSGVDVAQELPWCRLVQTRQACYDEQDDDFRVEDVNFLSSPHRKVGDHACSTDQSWLRSASSTSHDRQNSQERDSVGSLPPSTRRQAWSRGGRIYASEQTLLLVSVSTRLTMPSWCCDGATTHRTLASRDAVAVAQSARPWVRVVFHIAVDGSAFRFGARPSSRDRDQA